MKPAGTPHVAVFRYFAIGVRGGPLGHASIERRASFDSPASSFIFARTRPVRITDSGAKAAPFVVVANRDRAPSLASSTRIHTPRRTASTLIPLRDNGARLERRLENQIGEQPYDHFDLCHFEMTAGACGARVRAAWRPLPEQHTAGQVIG